MTNSTLQLRTEGGESENTKPLSFLEMLQSTLWAAMGVQKYENRKRDFERGKAHHFILMGIGFTAFFVCAMVSIVHLVINLAGS
ncbi:MAG: hypothetical protein ACI9ON_004316 [Limisphaerales bacterium]|jgi:hypothetical protein